MHHIFILPLLILIEVVHLLEPELKLGWVWLLRVIGVRLVRVGLNSTLTSTELTQMQFISCFSIIRSAVQ